MSCLAEFRKLEQQLAVQLSELETLKNDSGLEKEIEFETKLRDLLPKYNFSLRDVISILDPQASSRKGTTVVADAKITRKMRSVKVYKNPHSGEIVETKGRNHKTLKEWKSQYSSDEVESWVNR
ncbi:DNA binding protein [Pseudomonas cichorii]|uniref:DNA binding protein n=1 Tax=Pseudomonas lijiangensis TaxID=2995658 RepID=A0ABX8HVQ4_9PSED|nr:MULTISPECIES: histone-like nucleoid-structuring protein, MvaT/MvaU family [Pseudomonas syringae group]MBX8498964.1 DNA binding protein [Pseudomonas lijiangensis]MBX8504167.1 DNA binding protein [Pseudomonas lijiangensis]MBX8508642.1 DNA binding protein [Pseudomonas cichorii]MBX8523698.1 DNA binding protein [Pseudomonas cichorii]MBX8554847.1 DNA binding protein [Pseudomonas cichorii]